MNMITDLVRMWLTRSIKPFVFTGEFDSRLPYEECEQLGLYVHIPFCRSVCNFCPYCKVEYSKEWCDRYIDALIQEIHLVGGRGEEKKRVTSLYFGGGTPALAAGRLKEIIDALGRPIDGLSGFKPDQFFSIENPYINPLSRPPISERMDFGIKAIDGTLSIGKGQRVGIFAGSGVGKSTLLGMIAKNVKADINVIALVGERGREVLEFVQNDLGEAGLARSILVVATSDQSAMLRSKCPVVATAIAEYFKGQGRDVLLMMDSLTRFSMAQREIGLAVGEPPIARGYTPSIYAELPKLLERSGNFEEGSITGIYTVLVEGDDTNEPIADTVRGILDGHIVLTRKLANSNHFPAIDVNASISRLMNAIVSKEHRALASKLRDILSVYEKNSDLISIGAYKAGTNPSVDYAISKIDLVNGFLKQGINESFDYDEVMHSLEHILS